MQIDQPIVATFYRIHFSSMPLISKQKEIKRIGFLILAMVVKDLSINAVDPILNL
jgi:hypothetical protein